MAPSWTGNRIQNAVEGSDRTTSIFAAEMSVELRAEWNAILGYTRLPHMDQGGRADAMLTSDVVAPVSAALDVLVVDDVLMNREIAGTFLRAGGHRVVCVEGGTEAVAAVAITDFDVVLMDVRMPKMDGLEATRRIRALEGARGRVPIVALTAHAFTEQVAECRNAGMDSHLAKPFNPVTPLWAVARVSAPGKPRVLNPTVFERTASSSPLRSLPICGLSLRAARPSCAGYASRMPSRPPGMNLPRRLIPWQAVPVCSVLSVSPRSAPASSEPSCQVQLKRPFLTTASALHLRPRSRKSVTAHRQPSRPLARRRHGGV